MWNIVCDDFCHLALKSFASRCSIKFINQRLIKVIPKNDHMDAIGGWFLITSIIKCFLQNHGQGGGSLGEGCC